MTRKVSIPRTTDIVRESMVGTATHVAIMDNTPDTKKWWQFWKKPKNRILWMGALKKSERLDKGGTFELAPVDIEIGEAH